MSLYVIGFRMAWACDAAYFVIQVLTYRDQNPWRV